MKCPDCGAEILVATSTETGREVRLEPKCRETWLLAWLEPLRVTACEYRLVEHACEPPRPQGDRREAGGDDA